MAATVTQPASPASCYRPIRFTVLRSDPVLSQIDEVFIADSSDVSTLGNDLQVGDVVMLFSSATQGPVPLQAGQTILMDAGCGPYAGVHMVTNYFTDSGDKYAVIQSANYGDYTPPDIGAFRVWLNNYAIHLRLLVYPTVGSAPEVVDLRATPDATGRAHFNVDLRIRDFFTHRIDHFVVPPTSGIAHDAHGVTALFYRVHIAEIYDVPGSSAVPDPFDGTHDVLVDDANDVSSYRVAVNAVHPFAGDVLNWSEPSMSEFVVGGTSYARKVLSMLPRGVVRTQSGEVAGRKVTLRPGERFGIHMLTDQATDYEIDGPRLRIYNLTNTPAIHGDVVFTMSGPTSSFRVGIGPGDLGETVDGMTRYAVWIRFENSNFHSEPIEVTVDARCKEGARQFAWLNKLGGVDSHTFTGREIGTSNTKRATVQKPYGVGTGFDWMERTYRAEPERSRVVSTAPIHRDVKQWLAEDLCESANVIVQDHGRWCPCIITSGDVRSYSTGPGMQPCTVEFRMGVDELSQQA